MTFRPPAPTNTLPDLQSAKRVREWLERIHGKVFPPQATSELETHASLTPLWRRMALRWFTRTP